jgi:hypothetical protein
MPPPPSLTSCCRAAQQLCTSRSALSCPVLLHSLNTAAGHTAARHVPKGWLLAVVLVRGLGSTHCTRTLAPGLLTPFLNLHARHSGPRGQPERSSLAVAEPAWQIAAGTKHWHVGAGAAWVEHMHRCMAYGQATSCWLHPWAMHPYQRCVLHAARTAVATQYEVNMVHGHDAGGVQVVCLTHLVIQ